MLRKNSNNLEIVRAQKGNSHTVFRITNGTTNTNSLFCDKAQKAIFGSFDTKITVKRVTFAKYYRKYRFLIQGRVLIYIIIFINLEKNSKIKIRLIRTYYIRKNGNNGNIYIIIEIILLILLFQEALYA